MFPDSPGEAPWPTPGRDGIGWGAHGPPALQKHGLFLGVIGLLDAQTRCPGKGAGWSGDELPAQPHGEGVWRALAGRCCGWLPIQGPLCCFTHRVGMPPLYAWTFWPQYHYHCMPLVGVCPERASWEPGDYLALSRFAS